MADDGPVGGRRSPSPRLAGTPGRLEVDPALRIGVSTSVLPGLTALLAVFTTLASGQAMLAPTSPSDGDIAARQEEQAAAAEVGRIAALVATAASELQRVSVVSEAADDAHPVAEGQPSRRG